MAAPFRTIERNPSARRSGYLRFPDRRAISARLPRRATPKGVQGGTSEPKPKKWRPLRGGKATAILQQSANLTRVRTIRPSCIIGEAHGEGADLLYNSPQNGRPGACPAASDFTHSCPGASKRRQNSQVRPKMRRRGPAKRIIAEGQMGLRFLRHAPTELIHAAWMCACHVFSCVLARPARRSRQ
jgi:hypothetical protein